jgi:uncharacterized protein YbjT (DUF2867 family)
VGARSAVAEERRGKAVVDLAYLADVEHLVYSALNGAGARSGFPYYESKARIEEHIRARPSGDDPATGVLHGQPRTPPPS